MVGGGRQESIETEIHVVNPMFGGGFDACEPNTKNPVRATVVRGSPAILGATVVSKHAGELIFPTVEMLQKGRGVKSLFGLILPYPTYMEMWNRAALTQWARQFAEASFTQRLVRLLTGFEKNRPANAQLRNSPSAGGCCGVAELQSWNRETFPRAWFCQEFYPETNQ